MGTRKLVNEDQRTEKDAIWNPPIGIYFSEHSINPKGIISVLLSRRVIDIHIDGIEP